MNPPTGISPACANWIVCFWRSTNSATTQDRPSVRIFWKDAVTYTQPRTPDARFIDVESWNNGDSTARDSCLLSTHVCLFRNSLIRFAENSEPLQSAAPLLHGPRLSRDTNHVARRLLTDPRRLAVCRNAGGIDAAETDLLKSVNKHRTDSLSQDRSTGRSRARLRGNSCASRSAPINNFRHPSPAVCGGSFLPVGLLRFGCRRGAFPSL